VTQVDNWIEAAFSTGGLVGHMSYVLLVVSMLMRDISYLRLFVIASALVGIAYDLFWLRNPVGVMWESVLLLVNVVQLYLLWRSDRAARFSEEEADFVARRLKGVSRGRARQFLDLGRWEVVPAGTALTRQGERPEFLTYLGSGQAVVEADGRPVARLEAGSYVGEMALIGDDVASASVRLAVHSRVWRVEGAKIDRLCNDHPAISNALRAGIADDMRTKIMAGNAGAQGGSAPV